MAALLPEAAIILLLILFNAVMAAAEIALVSARRTHLMALADEGNPGAMAAMRLLRDTSRFLATIQVGITITASFASAVGAVTFVEVLSQALAASPVPILQQFANTISLIIVTVAVSYFSIVLGELVPKHLAIRFAEPVGLMVARPLEWLSNAAGPLVALLSGSANLVLRLLGQGRAITEQRPAVTEADLRLMFDVAATEGDVEDREAQMLHRVFEFTDQRAQEVMTPRPEIVWLDQTDTLADFLREFAESYHARFPICDSSPDNIVGIIYIKDVFRDFALQRTDTYQPLTPYLRPAYFAPETKRVGALFEEMRAAGQQMAILVDEYGGTAGLVTLKQLVEEIVGPVGDEAGQGTDYQTINEHTFDIEGSMRIDEANEALGLDLPEGDYETVAGFLLSTLGRIPQPGDHVRHRDLRIVVTDMAGPKIERVRVTKEEQGSKAEG